MKEIVAYEMVFDKTLEYQNDIICVSFQEKYWDEYMKMYNECFYKMRKELEVEPVNFYYDYSQIKDKINDIFLYLRNGVIVGAVSCYEMRDIDQETGKISTAEEYMRNNIQKYKTGGTNQERV